MVKKFRPFLVILCLLLSVFVFATPVFATSCAGADTSIISCSDDSNGFWSLLRIILNIIMAGIGVVGTIGIIIAGIIYMTSAGDPAKTAMAKKRIGEVVVGIVAFFLFWSLSQLLLPNSNIDQIVAVTNISVNADQIEMYVGDSRKLGAVIEPAEALSYHTIVWTSSDDTIVETTKNGDIKAKKAGTATITATVDDISTSLMITVSERPVKTTDSDNTSTTSGDGTVPISPVASDSSTIACASGTIDLGIRDDAYVNGKRIPARVCEVPTIDCTSSYSFSSNGHAVVNSRASGAYLALGQRYMDQHSGKKLKATESYRTNARQSYFYSCYQTKSCNNGNLAAKPGYSNHQFGLAIDFDQIGGWNTEMSQWFYNNAGDFGLVRNVKSEYWHVNPQDSYF